MKRFLSAVLLALMAVAAVSCNDGGDTVATSGEKKSKENDKWADIKVECYDFTKVPTFECVTGIKCGSDHDSMNAVVGNGFYNQHRYYCSEDEAQELIDKYMDYMIDVHGYEKSSRGPMIVNNDYSVMVSQDSDEDGNYITVIYDNPYYDTTKIPSVETVLGLECSIDHDDMNKQLGYSTSNMHVYPCSSSKIKKYIDDYKKVLGDEGFKISNEDGVYYVRNSDIGDAMLIQDEYGGESAIVVYYEVDD